MKSIELIEHVCCKCGTTFSMDSTLNNLRKEDGKTFYCPNGCGQVFTTKYDIDKKIKDLEEELSETKQDLTDAQAEVRSLKCELLKYKDSNKNSLLNRIFR